MKNKWSSLTDYKNHLEKNNIEQIVHFNGHTLITNKAMYMLSHDTLHTLPLPKKEKKVESKSTKGRSNGSTADKERVGTHGRSDHVKPDRKKASKVCATKVPKKVSKPKKSPK